MAAKPSATTGWGTGTAIEPSAGKKALGWQANERPPAPYLQWLFKRIEDWLAYLKDGALEGAHSVSGLITATAGLTAAANQHVTVSGTGRFKHGDLVKNISPLHFRHDGNWAEAGLVTFGDSGYIVSTGAGRCVIPIDVDEGQRLKSLVFARYGNASSDITAVEVYRMTSGGAVTDIAAAATTVTDPPASWADTTVDLTDTTVAAGDTFYARITVNGSGLRIGSTRATYDRP